MSGIITNDGFYIKGLFIKINEEINNCIICNKKNLIKKPSLIQIISKGPKNEYQVDLTAISTKLKDWRNSNYILYIIDSFLKI